MYSSSLTAGTPATIQQYNRLREDARGASLLLCHESTTPSMTVVVESGYFVSSAGATVAYVGGTQVIGAVGAQPRWDLISINTSGTLVLTVGTAGASPAKPAIPAGNFPVCYIYLRVGGTSIKSDDDATNHYILDARKFFVTHENVAHTIGNENIGGVKTFTSPFGMLLSNSGDSDIILEKNENTTWWSKIRLQWRRTRGTFAVPLATAVDDIVGAIGFQGHNGSAYKSQGGIEVRDNGARGKMIVSDADIMHIGSMVSGLYAKDGFLINGYITRAVSTNNLILSIKTAAGTDPSATDPVYVRIGGVQRSITGALTKTFAAGTNTFHLGDTDLATKEVDLFVYLLWDTTNGIRIIMSRVPNAVVLGDFDTSGSPWLNERGYDGSGSGLTATDSVVNIGSINAIMGVGATYNWSVPGTSRIINRPIYTSELATGYFAGKSSDVGFRTIPQNSQSAAYTVTRQDSGSHIYHPSADITARTWTIPANSSVAYPIGTALTFVNDTSAGVITIAITTDTLVLAGAGTTGSRTLAANGIATAIKVTSTRWIISGTNLT